VEIREDVRKGVGRPTPYKKPSPDFPYRVCGRHPTLGYVEFGTASRKNAEERAEALREEGFQNIKLHDRATGQVTPVGQSV
jgi:hypothetical protein